MIQSVPWATCHAVTVNHTALVVLLVVHVPRSHSQPYSTGGALDGIETLGCWRVWLWALRQQRAGACVADVTRKIRGRAWVCLGAASGVAPTQSGGFVCVRPEGRLCVVECVGKVDNVYAGFVPVHHMRGDEGGPGAGHTCGRIHTPRGSIPTEAFPTARGPLVSSLGRSFMA